MRPAYLLAELAGKYQCQLEIEKDDMRVDAKSALSILTLGATMGTRLNLYANGDDAQVAISELAELISSRFPDEVSGDGKP
jgi:phosphocarrier protein